MKTYKFLGPGARGRFSRFAWPQPQQGQPGAWVEIRGALTPCTNGVHACRERDLPYWLDAELWLVELDGAQVATQTMVVAERGRLVERVLSWQGPLQVAFGRFCGERARAIASKAAQDVRAEAALAAGLANDVARLAQRGELATAAYVSAVAARCASDASAEDAYTSERSAQSDWLVERLA